MKIRFILLLCMLLLSSFSFCYMQDGFFGGVGSVGYTGSDVSNLQYFGLDYNDKLGFYFSFFHYSQPRSSFQFRTELALANRGSDFTLSDEEMTMEGTDEIWYVSVPVTGILNLPSSSRHNFYIGGGLSMNLAVSAKEKVSAYGQSETFEIYDDVNKLTLGYQLCGGINFRGSIVELRYDRQLGHLIEDSEANIYNDGILFLIGFKFR